MASLAWENNENLILCYHRVDEDPLDPYRLCVTPSHFEMQLRRMCRIAEPSTLDELALFSRQSRFAVTFDDGYADNLENALPIAAKYGVPITVFVTSGLIGDTRGFWWDRLADLMNAPDARLLKEIELGGEVVPLDLESPLGRSMARDRVHRVLRSWRVVEIDAFLDRLAKELDLVGLTPPRGRPLSCEELRDLAAHSDTVTIGAHTVEHTLMGGHSLDEQIGMAAVSKSQLEALSSRPVEHFAYPFGGSDGIDETSTRAVEVAGFKTASTTLPGTVSFSRSRYCLRRRVVMDWGHPRFELQIRHWGV